MFGLGKSNEQIIQDDETRKAAIEAASAESAETASTEPEPEAAEPEVVEAPVADLDAPPAPEPEDATVGTPAIAAPAEDVVVDEQVSTADAATAEVTKVDPETGAEHTEKVELTGDFPPFPADHKTSPSFDGHKYVVTAFADFGDGEKKVVVGYTHHSNGGGLLEYVDTHPLYSKPLLREMSFEEQIALAKAAV